MRSRYSAYVLGKIDYLIQTTLPTQQAHIDREAITAWSHQSKWLGLIVQDCEAATDAYGHAKVAFNARWEDAEGLHSHDECSVFVQRAGIWYFLDPGILLQAQRNDSCP